MRVEDLTFRSSLFMIASLDCIHNLLIHEYLRNTIQVILRFKIPHYTTNLADKNTSLVFQILREIMVVQQLISSNIYFIIDYINVLFYII